MYFAFRDICLGQIYAYFLPAVVSPLPTAWVSMLLCSAFWGLSSIVGFVQGLTSCHSIFFALFGD